MAGRWWWWPQEEGAPRRHRRPPDRPLATEWAAAEIRDGGAFTSWRAVAASGADVATGHGRRRGAREQSLAGSSRTVDGTEFHDAEVACGSWTRVLRSQVSLPPPVAVVMERLPNDRALFHKG